MQSKSSNVKLNFTKDHSVLMSFQRGTVPNANRMNETEARRLCNKQFANSIIYNIEDKPISAEPYIEECGLDLMVSDYTRLNISYFCSKFVVSNFQNLPK